MKPVALIALLTAAALAIAACGGSSTTTTTVTETTSDATTTPPSSSTTDSTSTTEDGSPPAADIVVQDSTSFVTPSGNIGCFIDKHSVRCDIDKREWKPPKAPADCNLDYGQGIELTAGAGADFVCAGDTTLQNGGQTLGYGKSISAGLLRCESEQDGLTCTDTENGSGFFMSVQSYKIF